MGSRENLSLQDVGEGLAAAEAGEPLNAAVRRAGARAPLAAVYCVWPSEATGTGAAEAGVLFRARSLVWVAAEPGVRARSLVWVAAEPDVRARSLVWVAAEPGVRAWSLVWVAAEPGVRTQSLVRVAAARPDVPHPLFHER